MKTLQLSVYLPNKPAELATMTSYLAQFDVNIKAISVSDAGDYGVVRLITNEIERAAVALKEMGYGFITTEVVTAEIPDRPGALSNAAQALADAGINIRYIYGSVTPGGGVALAVFSTEDNDLADKILSAGSLFNV